MVERVGGHIGVALNEATQQFKPGIIRTIQEHSDVERLKNDMKDMEKGFNRLLKSITKGNIEQSEKEFNNEISYLYDAGRSLARLELNVINTLKHIEDKRKQLIETFKKFAEGGSIPEKEILQLKNDFSNAIKVLKEAERKSSDMMGALNIEQ